MWNTLNQFHEIENFEKEIEIDNKSKKNFDKTTHKKENRKKTKGIDQKKKEKKDFEKTNDNNEGKEERRKSNEEDSF